MKMFNGKCRKREILASRTPKPMEIDDKIKYTKQQFKM